MTRAKSVMTPRSRKSDNREAPGARRARRHGVSQGIDDHLFLQPGGQTFGHRKKRARQKEERKNQKRRDDLKSFQTLQKRPERQSPRHARHRGPQQKQKRQRNAPRIDGGKEEGKNKQDDHLQKHVGAASQHLAEKNADARNGRDQTALSTSSLRSQMI